MSVPFPRIEKLKSAHDVNGLVQALRDDSWWLRWAAANALGQIGVMGAVEPLLAALRRDDDARVRQAVAQALGSIRDARAVEPLLAALRRDDDARVRQAVAQALRRIGGPAVDWVFVTVTKDRPKERPMPAFSSVLYYPYIDVKNERWLRSAALFWDSIRTIVPESYGEPYSSAFARELDNEGVLAPVRVSSDMEEVESLTDTVLDFLTDPASAGVLGTEHHTAQTISSMLVDIHPAKLPYMIREQFDRAINDEGWYEVAPGFANFYMTLLASRIADRLGLGLVTDSSTADQLALAVHKGKPLGFNDSDLSGHRRFGRDYGAFGPRRWLPREVAPGLLIELVVKGIELPRELPVKDLLKFKKDHRDELALFRREVSRLTTDLPNDACVEALRQAVHDQYEAQVLPAMKSLRHSLRAQGWDAALNGFLKVSFFTAAPTSAAILAGLPSSVALLAGVGVSLTASAVLWANQWRRTRMDSPYSYLLSLERQW